MKLSLVFCFLVQFNLLFSQNFVQEYNLKLIDIVMEDMMSFPVSTRVYVYSNIAAYEVLALQNPQQKSLSNQIPHFQLTLDSIPQNIDIELAASAAMVYTAKHFIFSENLLMDYYHEQVKNWGKKYKDTLLISNSEKLGKSVASKIITWSKGDNYSYTRTLQRYVLSDSQGAWRPTPPEYTNGLEPNWYLMRSMIFPKDSFIDFTPNVAYSESKKSLYYKNAHALYLKTKQLSSEEIEIANYWDDNPVTTISKGHLSYIVKKPSPGAHWMKLLIQLLKSKNYSLMASSEVITMASIGMYESIIQCWHTKYSTNALRPIDYINKLIDPTWSPLIETPPFPEYTSGHSVFSSCVSRIATTFIPLNHDFVDSSQTILGMMPRKFNTFKDAANEASRSRFYGGIHYMPALENGMKQGDNLAKIILSKIRLK